MIVDNDLKNPTLDKIKEATRLTSEIINNLDDLAIQELMGGTGDDIDELYNVIFKESYNTLYGEVTPVKESSYQYLTKLTDSIEETLRIENLNYFVVSIFPEFELEWFHLEWGQFGMMYKKLCIEAARGIGKSFYWSNVFPIWKMYRYKGKDTGLNIRRDLNLCERGYIVTNEMGLGIDLMEILKGNIEENPILNSKLFPGKKGKWNDQNIRCKNGARLGLKSYGGSFRGRHPGYVIVDDFLKDNVLYSEMQRKKATDYFHSVIMNALLSGGQAVVVGTPFHASDLYGDLKSKMNTKSMRNTATWKVFEYPGLFPDGRVLSPLRLPYHELMEKKETQGNIIFSREILVRPIVSDSSIFPYETLEKAFLGMDSIKLVNNRESYGLKFNKVVMGCDFAMSASVGADYSVFSTWGVTEADEMYLMHIYRAKGKSFTEQLAILKSIYSNFRHDVIFAEDNQMQRIFVEGMDKANLPVFPHTTGTNKYDLKTGLPGLAIMFERYKIKLPRGDEYSRDMTDIIVSEFSSVAFTDKGLEGVGAHDDCTMSTWIAGCAMRHMTNGSGVGLTFLD